MKATVDANILFSCIIKEGKSRRLWFSPSINLYAPAFILEEFKKYAPLLLEKYAGKPADFAGIAEKLLGAVEFVTDNELIPFLPAANSLLEDKKDILYLACAIKKDTIIWSNDKGFKRQHRIAAMNTAEMMEEFGML